MGPAVGASSAEAPQLDGAVQVTAAATPFRAYASPTLAVDRRRPDTLALATADTRNSQCSLQISTNGGRSWTELPGPKVPDWPNCVRNTQGPIASLAFDGEGTLYYAFVGWKPTDWHSRIFLGRSEDLGRTFQVTTLPGLEAHEDRGDIGSNALPAVVLDPTRAGRVYVSWSGNYGLWNLDPLLPAGKTQNDFPRRAMLATSNDGGRTFGEPIDLGGDPKTSHTQPQVTVGKDGSVFAFFGEWRGAHFSPTQPAQDVHIFQAVSRDGGKTFDRRTIHTTPGGDNYDFLITPVPAVDPRSGDVYLAWEDAGRRPTALLFMRSSDRGNAWSEPMRINDVEPRRHWDFSEMNPWMTVTSSGRIDVAWYDWRDDTAFVPAAGATRATDALQNVYYSSSADGGRTWTPDVRITDRSIDRRLSDVWTTGVHGPVGLASTDDTAYFAWDDTRNATADSKAQDVYSTRLRLGASAADGAGGSTGSGTNRLVWALFGVSLGLVVSGSALLLARRAASSSPAARAMS
ncbi:MAG TPA: exo-alpha-sialidase [Acidimicrobiales bacterium]|nr:exo-alpha-sialidase [Acidimicrobiales bacterium]